MTLTADDILDRCRSEWLFRDLPEAEVDDMVAELRDHLDDASGAGRPPAAVVGEDLNAFASAWAAERRAERPRRRTPRQLALHAYSGAAALLLGHHLVGWSARVEVVPGSVAAIGLFAALMSCTPYWRALLHWPLGRWMALCFGFSALLLALFLVGGAPVLFSVPLWGTALFCLPAFAVAAASRLRPSPDQTFTG
ncbi:hypothetical protein [Streptomyces sp. MUM 178J]|uniref:hypothetical protein n=1 Tax=Streptomyces sp. MUM 178J TaxID=2791991 RepID=UPI001F040620|nr:hypothetical protein [Streptomyces sp. MUM 178J]WRQ82701.1 hypothetical protein I3F59_026990 [Streptomyces sp. MUM 178J]